MNVTDEWSNPSSWNQPVNFERDILNIWRMITQSWTPICLHASCYRKSLSALHFKEWSFINRNPSVTLKSRSTWSLRINVTKHPDKVNVCVKQQLCISLLAKTFGALHFHWLTHWLTFIILYILVKPQNKLFLVVPFNSSCPTIVIMSLILKCQMSISLFYRIISIYWSVGVRSLIFDPTVPDGMALGC